MKHLKTFEGFSNVELTNEEEIWGLFKSSESKGWAIATQGYNFKMYVQQALDPRSGRTGKPLTRVYGDVDLSDLTKADFMKFAQIAKKLDLDYKAIKGAVKADDKLEKIFNYICDRGYSTAEHTSTNTGTRSFGSGEGPVDRYSVNPDFDPVAEVEKCKERVEAKEPAKVETKNIAPKDKFESKSNKGFRRIK